MSTTPRKQYLVPLLFAGGLLCVTAGVVATFQSNIASKQTPPEPAVVKNESVSPPVENALEKKEREEEEAKESADKAQCKELALSWLALLDTGKYEAAAAQTDDMRNVVGDSIAKDKITRKYSQIRSPMGAVISRTWSATESAPFINDITIEFNTSFENLKQRTVKETVIFTKNEHKVGDCLTGTYDWRVQNYYLQ